MSCSIGIDIGGTKIAAALFDADFNQIAKSVVPTPLDYESLLEICCRLVSSFDAQVAQKPPVGIGIPGAAEYETGIVYHAANTPALVGHRLGPDLAQKLSRNVRVANDADCAALSEAMLGSGRGYRSVFSLIMGTGVGGGLVYDGKLVGGAHGLTGEIGHLPLPFRDERDGPVVLCSCGQYGCIDKTISGPGLVRLHSFMTGEHCDTVNIIERVQSHDVNAVKVLEQFLQTIAKAFVAIIHAYDPDIILISGGLNNLPNLYQRIPELLGQYTITKNPKTRIAPAMHGAASGLRGAALLVR